MTEKKEKPVDEKEEAGDEQEVEQAETSETEAPETEAIEDGEEVIEASEGDTTAEEIADVEAAGLDEFPDAIVDEAEAVEVFGDYLMPPSAEITKEFVDRGGADVVDILFKCSECEETREGSVRRVPEDDRMSDEDDGFRTDGFFWSVLMDDSDDPGVERHTCWECTPPVEDVVLEAFEAAPEGVFLFTCDRCGNEKEGARYEGDAENHVPAATSGFFNMEEVDDPDGFSWGAYAKTPDEKIVCDTCMFSDPAYIEVYGQHILDDSPHKDPPEQGASPVRLESVDGYPLEDEQTGVSARVRRIQKSQGK